MGFRHGNGRLFVVVYVGGKDSFRLKKGWGIAT